MTGAAAPGRRTTCRSGDWVNHWLADTAPEVVAETYRTLGALVADGTLRAPVDARYPLEDWAAALQHAGRPDRTGKVLFTARGNRT